MKDIKLLYSSAKNRGWNSDVTAYNEAVNELLNSNPNDYVTNLEYIITTSPGLKTFKEFVSNYGLCLGLYNEAMDLILDSIHKCERDGKPTTAFEEAKAWMESFYNEHINEIRMFEWFVDEDKRKSYVESYYGFNQNGIQNRKLVKGMIEKFGEYAVPDVMITAKNMGAKSTKVATEFIESYYMFESPLFFEYLNNICEISESSKAKCASTIVSAMKERNNGIFRESVITGNDNMCYEYSQTELDALRDLISYKEYSMLWEDVDSIKSLNEILSLYEEFDGMEFTESDETMKGEDDLVPVMVMLPHYDKNIELPDEAKKDEKLKRWMTVGKTINKVTYGDQYSHAVVVFDDDFKTIYSFDSLGMSKESLDEGVWKYTKSIFIAVLYVTKKEKDSMLKMCRDMDKNKNETKYAFSDLMHLVIGTKNPRVDNRFICSSFAAFLLASANPRNVHRDYSNIRPEDVTILPRAFYICNAKNSDDLKEKLPVIKQKITAIKDEHAEEIDDYNNQLPKMLLKNTMRSKKTLDNILDDIFRKKLG